MADSIYTFDPTAASNTALDSIAYGPNQLYHSNIDNLFRAFAAKLAQHVDDLGGVNTVGGTANAITVTIASGITAYATGQFFRFKNTGGPNTTATTINVNSIGAKEIRLQGDTALSGGEMLDNGYYGLLYDAAYDGGDGGFILLNPDTTVDAATTGAAGIVELATLAETLAYTDASRVVTPSTLPLPTGYLYGLTLANGTDATNDINIAAGSARDASDSYNFLLGSTYVKQIDAAWALGSAAGGLDTGSVGNNRYAIWGIGRSDTRVCDVLFSTSFSAPTMPANYDFKVLIGEFTRTGGVNGTPLWYGPRRAVTGYAGITLEQSVASTSGTSISYTGIPSWTKRITIQFAGVSTSGSSLPIVQIGPAGGVETSGYLGSAATVANAAASAGSNGTTGFLVLGSMASGIVFHGTMVLTLCDPSTNTWVASVAMGRSDAGSAVVGGASKSLAGVLTQLAITTVGGTDTFDLGKVNIVYES